MKKVIIGTLLFALLMVVSIPKMAGAMGGGGVNVSIGLPPPIEFSGPPEMIVLPETYVYVVPDLDVDIFFYNGWWWRPWQGRWYRSQYYNSGWGYYQGVPSFYGGIPSGWRNDYRSRRWRGHQWNYQRIHHQQVERNWKSWEKSRHWENQQTWGVEGLKPRTRSQQHQEVGPQTRVGQPQHPQKQQGSLEKGKVQQQHQKKVGSQSGEDQPQHLQKQQGSLEKGKVQQQHQKKVGSQSGEDQQQHQQKQQGNHENKDVEKEDKR